MSRTTFARVLPAAVAALVSASAVRAEVQHPNLERGQAIEKSFQQSDIDNINLYNGNLTLTIPIGIEYPVGGSFSYKLNLFYNSKLWDWDVDCATVGGQTTCQQQPTPLEEFNAGFGWNLSLGELEGPASPPGPIATVSKYISPDGAEHFFHKTLHEGDPVVTNVLYTRDDTYLRLKWVGSFREIEFPDGTIHRFDGQGRVVKIRDRFANALDVGYQNGGLRWVLSDNHGRSHTIEFVNRLVDGELRPHLSKVTLQAFGSQNAVYQFFYRQQSIERPCPFQQLPQFPLGRFATLQLLEDVRFPDGSRYFMPAASSYALDRAQGCAQPGVLRKVQLPTFGFLEWSYGRYRFPRDQIPDIPGPPPEFQFITQPPGVIARRLRNPNNSLVGTWSYNQGFNAATAGPNIGGSRAIEVTNQVTDAAGNRTVHFFTAHQVVPPNTDGRRWDDGLPISPRLANGSGTAKKFLSRRHYKGAGSLKRSIYLRFERDEKDPFGGPFGDRSTDVNRRISRERIIYNDDGGRFSESALTGFDGLGHYRTRTLSGNFSAANARTELTNFNPAVGTYNVDPATGNTLPGHNFTMLAHTAPWVLETFSEKRQTEGGVTARQTFCFEAANGFLKRQRLHKSGTATNAKDVIVSFVRDARGNLTEEHYHGGDNRNVGTGGNLCAVGLGGNDYRVRHAYTAGTRRLSVYRNASGTDLTFRSVDLTIDVRTGLASASRDVAGVQTGFEYDKLGRMTWIKPPASGWTQFIYNRATSGSSLAQVRILKRGVGKTSAVQTQRESRFDPFGRIAKERLLMPSGTWSTQETRYNAMGWKTMVSELQSGTPNKWTRFQAFDAFGRASRIRPPDGSVHDINVTYTGDRVVSRTLKIRTSGNASTINESSATTTQQFDRQGRLWRVQEPGGVQATYTYDVGGRLKRAALAAGGVTQVREMIYDNRGFLTAERHPELAASQNGGWINYSMIDARGHAGRVSNNGLVLRQLFDRAERLWQIKDAANGNVWKQWVFASANSGSDRRKGKLQKAIRHNRVIIPWPPNTPIDVVVTEEYRYQGRDGRVSRRDTTLSTGQAFNQTWTWDLLGNVSVLGYPKCTAGNCATAVQPTRNQTFQYTRGFLTGVPGWASNIQYHPSGLISRITHTNGTSLFFDADPNGLRRPSNVRLTTPGGTAELGLHRYDGAGNLVARGLEYYHYDLTGRLTRYNTTSASHQTYAYDAFGNLNQVRTVTGGTVTRTLAINRAKNRLSAGIYDARGNLLRFGTQVHSYDALDAVTHTNFPLKTNVYTADDHRIWEVTFRNGQPLEEQLTLRNLDGQTLRVIEGIAGVWSWKKDYIHRDDVALAVATSETSPRNLQHFGVDHQGSARLITDRFGTVIESHHFYGFGDEIVESGSEDRRFVGHERDLNDPGTLDNLDYMLARYYSPHLGRFLNRDPGRDVDIKVPQSWNQYAYARNNPLKLVDRDGKAVETAWDALNVGIGVASLINNIRQGNVGGAIVDGIGLAIDLSATAVPFVPGGASTTIKTFRAANRADDAFAVAQARRIGARSVKIGQKQIDDVVESAGRAGGTKSDRSQALRKLDRKQGDPDRLGLFEGIPKTEAAAQGLVRDILENAVTQVSGRLKISGFAGQKGFVFFDKSGRGVLIAADGTFITFLEEGRGLGAFFR